MANHKSALKRAKQNLKRQMRNKSIKTKMKNFIKMVRQAVEEKSVESAKNGLIKASSIIDKAAKKGIIHANTASRKISRLHKLVNTVS